MTRTRINTPAPAARINNASAAEIVDLRHIRPKRAKLIRATEVDPRGTRVHRAPNTVHQRTAHQQETI